MLIFVYPIKKFPRFKDIEISTLCPQEAPLLSQMNQVVRPSRKKFTFTI